MIPKLLLIKIKKKGENMVLSRKMCACICVVRECGELNRMQLPPSPFFFCPCMTISQNIGYMLEMFITFCSK